MLNSVTRRASENIYPLSTMQQGMLFESLANPQAGVNIQQLVGRLYEEISVTFFQQAWQDLLQRHAILRTDFLWENSKIPLQTVKADIALPFQVKDWSSVRSKEEALQNFLQLDRSQEFNLQQAPLMRLTLIQIERAEYIFIWTFHHILLDGRSIASLVQEAFSIYEAYIQGQSLESLHLERRTSYEEYITWLQKQDFSQAKDFWQDVLAGFTAPTPLIGSRLAGKKISRHKELSLCLSSKTTSALQAFIKQHNLTMNAMLQGAWGMLLSRYSGEEDVVFGAVKSCRNDTVAGANTIAGLMINTLPVRAKVCPEMFLLDYLRELRSQWIALRPYEQVSLSQIQVWSDVPIGTPLFQSILMFENYELNSLLRQQGGNWLKREFKLYQQTSQSLTVAGCLTPDLLLEIEYDSVLFDDPTIQRMLGHIQTLLESMVASPEQHLSNLVMLPTTEREELLTTWNRSNIDIPLVQLDKCVYQLIEEQVAIRPDAIALVNGDRHLSYGELNNQANRLARYLRSLGVEADVLVAIAIERSLEMAVALLAILKAGGAYVPIDPNYPLERIAYMLTDSQASVILTSKKCKDRFSIDALPLAASTSFICLDTDRHLFASQSAANLESIATPKNLAYVIYTSGSTGNPKGVQIMHQGLINHAKAIARIYEISPSDRVLQFSTIGFDIAVEEIFPTWVMGATLVLRNDEMIASSQAFSEAIAQMQITILNIPTAFWHEWVRGMERVEVMLPDSLRLVVVGGEKVSASIFAIWKKLVGKAVRWLNAYGPTEATVTTTIYESELDDRSALTTEIPIGRPLPNTQVYILDKYLQPCPIGAAGELYIGGVGLAKGYLNQPELTTAKFIPNPFIRVDATTSDRLYRTGDLVRYLSDGNIDFLGRTDYQVKIRGFRIEIEEIEAALVRHPDISEAVIVVDERSNQKKLIAYMVGKSAQPLVASEVSRFLQQSLPTYMMPSAFIQIDAMPITPGGKIDRRILAGLSHPPVSESVAKVSPRNETETKLVEIWESVLGIQPIGVTDNFFEIGGNSLLAMSIFIEIETSFKRSISLSILFQAPTIAQLAIKIRDPSQKASWRSLVAIQPQGTKLPLFLIHPIKGDILCYADLARALGTDRPFYGLQARGLDGKSQTQTSIEEIASDYIAEILTVQSQSPYYIGGYSFGGVVAFEIAQQLTAQGYEVRLVALLDPYPPQFLSSSDRIQRHLKRLSRIKTTREKLAYIRGRFTGRARQLMINFVLKTGGSLSPDAKKFVIEETFHQAFSDYIPKPYQGRLMLFKGSDVFVDDVFSPTASVDASLEWGKLAAQGMDIYDIPVPHADLLKSPNVDLLAEKLQLCLQTLTDS